MAGDPETNGAERDALVLQAQEQALAYARDLRRLFAEERARRLELERAHRRLEDETRRRADFVGLLAHELRTPITALVGYLGLLVDGSLGPLRPEQQAAVEVLNRRAGDLARLVAELSQYAALVSDCALQTGPLLELPAYLERALRPIRARAEERAIELSVSTQLESTTAEVDLGLVSMAAAQLADNAVKFGRPGGWARVDLGQQGQRLHLTVEDNGPGLSSAVRERLFEDFNVGESIATRRHGGLGLGLAIVAHAARTLGAQISLDSQIGAGTCVRLAIPLHVGGSPR